MKKTVSITKDQLKKIYYFLQFSSTMIDIFFRTFSISQKRIYPRWIRKLERKKKGTSRHVQILQYQKKELFDIRNFILDKLEETER